MEISNVWQKGWKLVVFIDDRFKQEEPSVEIAGNREGLISLANLILRIAENENEHVHLDKTVGLEKRSNASLSIGLLDET